MRIPLPKAVVALILACGACPVQAQEAGKIVDQYVKAAGGGKALGKIQTLAIEGTFTSDDGKAGSYTFEVKLPNRYYSELLVGNESLSSEQVSMAQKIGQQARRTRDLVSDLLNFAQQTPSEKALIDVSSLLSRALQIVAPGLEARNVRLETKVPSVLSRVWGNTNQLFQAFLQIIENALDALEEVGGGVLAVAAREEAGEVVIEFSDTGPGIREPEKVFDPFYTTKPIGKGTGLGLSAAYGIVQNHQGQIACSNRPEGGAVFILRFPVARQDMAALATSKT